MKKSLFLISVCICILFLFCGCSGDAAPSPSVNTPAQAEITSDTITEIAEEKVIPTSPSPNTAGTVDTADSDTEEAPFSVTFFDVGQADSALIQCNGKTMLIDGGNVADGTTVINGLTRCGVSVLDAVVVTHSDEDHIGGIPAVLEAFPVVALYEGGNTADTKIYQKFLSTVAAKGIPITYPAAGMTFALGESTVTILGPTTLATNPNNNSIVLRIDYKETSFLFTGDAMEQEEKTILAMGANLKADVLKVGHHGASESSSYLFLREIMPQFAIISVGAGNNYGHPHKEALSRLEDAGATVFRTDLQGEIYCTSDGKNIAVSAYRNVTDSFAAAEAQTEIPETCTYIGNINSKKYHLPTCSTLPKGDNAVYFVTKEEAVKQGYNPCSRCNP